MLLDEFLKQREAKAPVLSLPTERKANEGVDQAEVNKWGTYQELKRNTSEEEVHTGTKDRKKKK